MLKGIEKNLNDNYYQTINLKRKDQLKTKEDVSVTEAFELYMLKKFHKIKLNSLTTKMLNFWEKDFDKSIDEHFEFLSNNLEDQNNYSSKFSKILQGMEIFDNEQNDDDNEAENNKDEQQNQSTENDDSQSDNQEEKTKNEETQAGLDADYNIDEYKIDEQLTDTNSDKENSENVIQKTNINNIDQDYKIFTNEFAVIFLVRLIFFVSKCPKELLFFSFLHHHHN